MNIRKVAFISIGMLVALQQYAHGDALANSFFKKDLSSRVYSTWLGDYVFSEEMTLTIEGLDDLYLLVYRCSGKEGTLIEFANRSTNGVFHLLQKADLRGHDVTSTFEGTDVFPNTNEAEIIIRWKHPGQGGLRSVEKYYYRKNSLVRISRANFVTDGKKTKWVSDQTSESSTPATRAPSSGRLEPKVPANK